MKQRLNLDSLLKKYQQNYGLDFTPPSYSNQPQRKYQKVKTEGNVEKDPPYSFIPNWGCKPKSPPQEYYQTGNFQMSRSECEKYLLSIRGSLKKQQQRIDQQLTVHFKELASKFEKQHKSLRAQLLNLLEHSLEINRKTYLQMLKNERKNVPSQLDEFKRIIVNTDQDISRLLTSLASSDFRKTIAEVVTRDFKQVISTIRDDTRRDSVQFGEEGYKQFFVDKQKIKIIQQSLQNIYQWSSPFQGTNTSNNRDSMGLTRRSTKQRIFQSHPHPLTQRQSTDRSAPKRMRRTFFNFEKQE